MLPLQWPRRDVDEWMRLPVGDRLHITPRSCRLRGHGSPELAAHFGDYNGDGRVRCGLCCLAKQLGNTHMSAYYNAWRSSFGFRDGQRMPLVLQLSSLPELSTCKLFC